MMNSRDVIGYGAIGLAALFGVYAYNGNRELISYEGTVAGLSMNIDQQGPTMDFNDVTMIELTLENGQRLGFHESFTGDITPGNCYLFSLVNTVSAPVLTGVRGEITNAVLCDKAPSQP